MAIDAERDAQRMDTSYAQSAYDDGDAYVSSRVTDPAPEDWTGRERRMNLRAYNYWESLLGGRPFPSVTDLDPVAIEPFAKHSLLIDFTKGYDAPTLRYIGSALRAESGINGTTADAHGVPRGTVLSRLTDHYLEILANRAPVGFEAEFTHREGAHILYRGILMPLSDDGEQINFIYGVVSWKEDNKPANIPDERDDILELDEIANDEPAHFEEIEEDELQAPAEIDADAGLPDLLALSRTAAERFAAADGRSRTALYDALGFAHAFAVAAQDDGDEYQAILSDAGLKAQARAPFTPIVKLIFGVDHDKTRLTEYATALAYAARLNIAKDGFAAFVHGFDGGLKAMIKAERAERRGENAPKRADKAKDARKTLREAKAVHHIDLDDALIPDDEFILMLGRKNDAESGIDLLSILEQKGPALDQLLTRIAERLKKS